MPGCRSSAAWATTRWARETVANLTANGVDTTGIRVVAETATGVAPIWVDERGANRILIAPGANNALDATHVRSALDALDRPPDVVVAQLETPQPATAAAFAWAAEHEVVTVLNPAPAATIVPEVLEHTTWLVPNEPEFELLFGTARDGRQRGRRRRPAQPRRHLRGRWRARRRRVIGSPRSRPRSSTSSTPPVPATPSSVRSASPSPPTWPRSTRARLAVAAAARSVTARGTQRSFPALEAVIAALDHQLS